MTSHKKGRKEAEYAAIACSARPFHITLHYNIEIYIYFRYDVTQAVTFIFVKK